MRVLLTDRTLVNGYTLGLAGGLRAGGARVWIGGPARSGERSVTAIYPRSGVPGQRVGKVYDATSGLAAFFHLLLGRARPDVIHFQWPTALDATYALLAKRLCRAA